MDPLSLAITGAVGLGSAWVLQKSKEHTSAWDNKVGEWMKPAQPAILMGLTVAAPWLASKGFDIGDPSTVVNAPLSAVVGLVALNYLKKIKK